MTDAYQTKGTFFMSEHEKKTGENEKVFYSHSFLVLWPICQKEKGAILEGDEVFFLVWDFWAICHFERFSGRFLYDFDRCERKKK